MAHWKYLPIIPTINKGLLNEKMLLSIIVVLRQNFLNPFIKIDILHKIYQCSSWYAKLEQHWVECICVHSSPITHLLITKKSELSISAHFHKNSLNTLAVITISGKHYRRNSSFWKLEQYWVRLLCAHNSPIIKLLFYTKIWALLRRRFSQKFPVRGLLYFQCAWGQSYNTK